MVNNFENYKLVFKSLQHYCLNKKAFDNLRPIIELPTEYYLPLDDGRSSVEYVLHDPDNAEQNQHIYENCI